MLRLNLWPYLGRHHAKYVKVPLPLLFTFVLHKPNDRLEYLRGSKDDTVVEQTQDRGPGVLASVSSHKNLPQFYFLLATLLFCLFARSVLCERQPVFSYRCVPSPQNLLGAAFGYQLTGHWWEVLIQKILPVPPPEQVVQPGEKHGPKGRGPGLRRGVNNASVLILFTAVISPTNGQELKYHDGESRGQRDVSQGGGLDWFTPSLVTSTILFCWIFTIKGRRKECFFCVCGKKVWLNEGLRHLF